MAEVGAVLGVQDSAGIRQVLGPRWAYRLRDAITCASVDDWQLLLLALTRLRS